ncbi:MAG: hypothetical protein K0R62_4504 [Nonomuraea muscovyensis]|nr:hypothetical protein [Nonomuraea muscovyensis]
MPILGRLALPSVTSSCATRRAWLTGMAKPRPMLPLWLLSERLSVAMAELTPTTSPLPLTSGPPELPGLMAASVWMALM